MITVENIVGLVARHYKLEPKLLYGQSRKRFLSHPRQLAMALARWHTDLSLPKIGSKFGGRDHSTVIHACQRVEERIEAGEIGAVVVAIRYKIARLERLKPHLRRHFDLPEEFWRHATQARRERHLNRMAAQAEINDPRPPAALKTGLITYAGFDLDSARALAGREASKLNSAR